MLLRSDEAMPILISGVSAMMLSVAVLSADPVKTEPRSSMASVTEADVSSGVPLNEVPNPSRTLSAATVQTSKGEKIGEVRAVEIGSDGTPRAVKVATNGLLGLGTLTKSISANDLIYVKDRNILVSRLTKAEINALPSAPKKKSS